MLKKHLSRLAIMLSIAVTPLLANNAFAADLNSNKWKLDATDSSVSFTTVKKSNIVESSTFKTISGSIKNGKAMVLLDTASVETIIPIRNERIVKYVFKSEQYPYIKITTDLNNVKMLGKQAITKTKVPAKLSMRGVKKDIMLDVKISQLKNGDISVVSTKPVIISAKHYGMDTGVAKLQEIMNNIQITHTVPVNFSLVFAAK